MPGQQQLSAPGALYRDPTDYWLPIVGIVGGVERQIREGPSVPDLECPRCHQHTLITATSTRVARVLFFSLVPIGSTRKELYLCSNERCGYRADRGELKGPTPAPSGGSAQPVASGSTSAQSPPGYDQGPARAVSGDKKG